MPHGGRQGRGTSDGPAADVSSNYVRGDYTKLVVRVRRVGGVERVETVLCCLGLFFALLSYIQYSTFG